MLEARIGSLNVYIGRSNPKPYVSSARPVVEEVPELPEPHHGSRFAGGKL